MGVYTPGVYGRATDFGSGNALTWGPTVWGPVGAYNVGAYSLGLLIWDLESHLPFLKKRYRGSINVINEHLMGIRQVRHHAAAWQVMHFPVAHAS